jgi:hypothetical protein
MDRIRYVWTCRSFLPFCRLQSTEASGNTAQRGASMLVCTMRFARSHTQAPKYKIDVQNKKTGGWPSISSGMGITSRYFRVHRFWSSDLQWPAYASSHLYEILVVTVTVAGTSFKLGSSERREQPLEVAENDREGP